MGDRNEINLDTSGTQYTYIHTHITHLHNFPWGRFISIKYIEVKCQENSESGTKTRLEVGYTLLFLLEKSYLSNEGTQNYNIILIFMSVCIGVVDIG